MTPPLPAEARQRSWQRSVTTCFRPPLQKPLRSGGCRLKGLAVEHRVDADLRAVLGFALQVVPPTASSEPWGMAAPAAGVMPGWKTACAGSGDPLAFLGSFYEDNASGVRLTVGL